MKAGDREPSPVLIMGTQTCHIWASGGGQFMKRSSNLRMLTILMVIKVLFSIVLFVVPYTWFLHIVPLGFFSPFMLGAIAYSEITHGLVLAILIIVTLLLLCYIIIMIYAIIRKTYHTWFVPVLTIFGLLELVSLIMGIGAFSLSWIFGIILNIMIIYHAWKCRLLAKKKIVTNS